MCAGDTLGDAPFLTDAAGPGETPMRFICVGNASPQLKELCRGSYDDGRCIFPELSAAGALVEGLVRVRAELDEAASSDLTSGSLVGFLVGAGGGKISQTAATDGLWLRWGKAHAALRSALEEAVDGIGGRA